MTDRDKRMLMLLGVAIIIFLIVKFVFQRDTAPQVVKAGESAPMAEKRLAKLRQIAATVPAKESILKQVDADLSAREKGLLNTDTAAQATARLMEIARKDGKAEGIEIRGGDLGQNKVISPDYGEVTTGLMFDCRIDQFVNFMASLSHEPEVIATSDIRIMAGNPKEKTISVRMSLGGLAPKKLIPEKKGFASF